MKNKSKRSTQVIISSFAVLVLMVAAIQYFSNKPLELSTKSSFSPPQPRLHDNTLIPNSRNEGGKVPEEWLNRINKTAYGDDWRVIEANSIQQLIAEKAHFTTTNIQGDWVERGPSNIPGRIVDIEIDYVQNQIYALSDHGILFRSDNLEGLNWIALNDQHPLGLDVASQLEIFDDGNIVVSGWIKVDNDWGVYHSGDGGINWRKANGFSDNPITGIRRMAKQDDTVYVFVQEYDANQAKDFYVIYKSVDRGNNFSLLYQSPIPAGEGGRHLKSDLWVSNDPQVPNLYLMLEDSLFSVNKTTGLRTFNSMVSNLPVEQGLLTGLTQNGTTELTAYIATNGVGKFYAWNSTDQIWTFKGEMVDWWLAFPFGSNSLSCSKQSADILYFGGILTSKSTDRGATWTTMDLDPTGSFALYHGDVPKTLTTINPNTGGEEVYLGTDGGIYKMDENEHFNSISIPGLNCTQLYKMVSRQSSPGEMFIGTQDNGYAHTNLGSAQPGIVDFTFQWGGDVTNVASGDGGETFWLWWLGDGCNYMSGTDQVVSTWSPYDFGGGIPYWEAPIWIPSQYPDRCYTAGFLNNKTGNYLIELQANNGSTATPTQFGYNFEAEIGGKISAIAISPLNYNYFYIATENGYFAYSTDGGSTWISTLLSNSMYPRVIYPSHLNLGEVWVGGSGYSNSPVFHSTDNGLSFSDLNAGLLPCRVEAFATNADESVIFAATSIGPFAYEKNEASWSDISGLDAPLVQYMDVEFLNSENTARFATYARGIWDFQLAPMTSANSRTNGGSKIKAYPNPASEIISIEVGDNILNSSFKIVGSAGEIVKTGNFKSKITKIHISDFRTGTYFIVVGNDGNQAVKFFKL